MRLFGQSLVAVLLCFTTYFSLLRIAEAKNEAAAGPGVFPLAEGHREELEAFERLRRQLEMLGQSALSERLEQLRAQGKIWAAPSLGPERWAVFVESLRLVRRIYIRRVALIDPRTHLYGKGAADVPPAYQEACAWLSLGGALRHELAHYDGLLDEASAYDRELAWYEELRGSAFLASLQGGAREAWLWALDSAVLSARKAAESTRLS
jgi:hypothetical protein